jgi:outer membrane protein assembly factor BamB
MNLFRHKAGMLGLLFSTHFVGLAPAETALPEATNLWSFSFVSNLPYNSSSSTPAIALDGTIYLGTFDGTFFAITPDGKQKWRFKAGREIKSSPAVADDGTIYFGSRDRKFYALTAAGKLKWAFPTGAWVDSSPAIAADGTIYFGGWDKNFYALNPDGSLKWKFLVGEIVDSSPAIAADGTIYFGAHDKKVYALDPDGKVRWTFLTGGAIISSPAIGQDRTIYFTSLDGNLYALNPDGTEKWRYHSGSTTESSPILDEKDDICVGKNDSTLVVSVKGQDLWLWGSAVPLDISQIAVANHFYFSRPWGLVMGFASANNPVWQADMKANVSTSLVVDKAGVIYICARDLLYAIRPPGKPLPPAKSFWPMFRANARHTGRVGN